MTQVATTAGGTFQVRRVYCVGRNYAEHIREMGKDPAREPPFFFMKPTDAVVPDGARIPYPPATADFQHEVELVLAIGKGGSDIPAASAAGHVFGEAVGVDLTRRDVQVAAREAGRPWEAGKSFDQSAPCGPIRPCAGALAAAGAITLSVNGKERQRGDLSQMVWSSADIVAAASRLFRLEPGDLIFTGTPKGVGPLARGDSVEAQVAGLPALRFTIE